MTYPDHDALVRCRDGEWRRRIDILADIAASDADDFDDNGGEP